VSGCSNVIDTPVLLNCKSSTCTIEISNTANALGAATGETFAFCPQIDSVQVGFCPNLGNLETIVYQGYATTSIAVVTRGIHTAQSFACLSTGTGSLAIFANTYRIYKP
jgi:hypothetical protein